MSALALNMIKSILILLSLSGYYSKVHHSIRDVNLLKEQCGPKLASALMNYAMLHDDILHRRAPQRYLVSVPVEAGLADRLLGMISQFWLAFFSKHAFQIGSFEKLPRFEYAYDYRFINWTRPPDDEKYTSPLMFTYKGKRGYEGPRFYDPVNISLDHYHMEYLINVNDRTEQIYNRENLFNFPHKNKSFPYEPHTIFTSSNRGGIRYINSNDHLHAILKEWNIRDHTLFKCGYTFLFRENADVEQISAPFKARLQIPIPLNTSTSEQSKEEFISPLRVGVCIRAGDRSFDPNFDQQLTSSVYEKHIRCARSVVDGYMRTIFPDPNKPNKRVSVYPWFAMSESLKTRKMIAAELGKYVVVEYEHNYFHGDCKEHTDGGCTQEHLRQAIIRAVSQLQLYSMCNVHIISDSGFPQVGAMLSEPPYHIYGTMNFQNCSYQNPRWFSHMMGMGAGV